MNLVDNMVKLGSLYQAGSALENRDGISTPTILKERLEFNDKVQEKRLLDEENKEWQRVKPDVNDLQEKVDRLYDLDQLMQEESGNLLNLRQDKELLEKALGGLRHKMQGVHSPAEEERFRRQQHLLERELSSVRSVLANNSKVMYYRSNVLVIKVTKMLFLEIGRNCGSERKTRIRIGSFAPKVAIV